MEIIAKVRLIFRYRQTKHNNTRKRKSSQQQIRWGLMDKDHFNTLSDQQIENNPIRLNTGTSIQERSEIMEAVLLETSRNAESEDQISTSCTNNSNDVHSKVIPELMAKRRKLKEKKDKTHEHNQEISRISKEIQRELKKKGKQTTRRRIEGILKSFRGLKVYCSGQNLQQEEIDRGNAKSCREAS